MTKLTQRGKYVVVIAYTIIMTLLLTMVWNKYDVDCIDKYTADILATQFLYGEGEDVDRAMTAIYNNGGWIEEELTPDVEVIFPCLKNEGWV
jgi:uncharacterized membrane protein YkgB